MTELIKIDYSCDNETVKAKELYDFLGYDRSQWSRWYNKNILSDDFFVYGNDYVTLDIMSNGNKTKDFAISLDMAKELCMLARNEKGKQARQYFIEVEKKARKLSQPQLPQSFSEALQLAADQAKQLELQAPKVEFYEKVLESNSSFTTSQIADELDMTAQKLNKILKVENVIYKQSNEYHLYSKYKGKGYANIRTAPYKDSKGVVKTSHYLVWTEKGREFIHSIVSELSI